MLPLPQITTLPKATPRSFTIGTLPSFIDPQQPPVKKQPFAAVRTQKAISSLSLVLPGDLAALMEQEIEARQWRYAKVIMKLGDLLEGDLFTEGIKKSDIMMMSEGRRGVDNRYEFFAGTLRIELDKATYERAGLQGKPIPDGGQKHKHNRFAIEIDLRQPSMLHGKKGFERIIWACKNVLDESMTWVFADVGSKDGDAVKAALEKHHPRWFVSRPQSTVLKDVAIPQFELEQSKGVPDLDYAQELEEWLTLVMLRSSRVMTSDKPDPFICRYSLPSSDGRACDDEMKRVSDLRVVQWHGFMPSKAVIDMLIGLRRAAQGQHWFAIQSKGSARDRDGLTILHKGSKQTQGVDYLCWHVPS